MATRELPGLTEGQRIRRVREQRMLTQKELADMIGTKQSGVARIEKGVHPPNLRTLQKIGKALGVDWRDLAGA